MKVRNAMRHRRARLDLVFIPVRPQLKPAFWSTTSTIVMAHMRKNRVVEVSPRCSWMIEVTAAAMPLRSPV